jgi:hypothetical protein
MKWIAFNIASICLMLLSAFMMYNHTPDYGWVIAAACAFIVYPSSKSEENES